MLIANAHSTLSLETDPLVIEEMREVFQTAQQQDLKVLVYLEPVDCDEDGSDGKNNSGYVHRVLQKSVLLGNGKENDRAQCPTLNFIPPEKICRIRANDK